MAVETADDRAIFFSVEDFGVAASYTKIGGNAQTINGIFDNEYLAEDAGAGVVFAVTQPRFLCRTSDLPSGAGEGDAITISAVAYTVKVIESDGTGISTLVLEKN